MRRTIRVIICSVTYDINSVSYYEEIFLFPIEIQTKIRYYTLKIKDLNKSTATA